MWEDDPSWIPLVLEGKYVHGEFWFDKDFNLTRKNVIEVANSKLL
jgi:hypothetical protein